jgi:hypothetical protein
MKTLRDEKCRSELSSRIARLTSDSKPLWGRMTVEQMLSHLVQSGEMPFVASVPDRSSFMSRTLVKTLVLTVVPVPKEVKTSAELDQQQGGRKPLGLDIDKTKLTESIEKIGTLPKGHPCLAHPFFGKLSARQWSRIGYKHIDHHLRQFGV